METKRLIELREKLEFAILSAKSKGFTITSKDWGNDTGEVEDLCCCPMGAILIQNKKPILVNDPVMNEYVVAQELGLSTHEVDVFTSVYDHDWNAVPDKADPDIVDLAEEIREKYLKELSVPEDFED